jgi:hypothetical protein
MHGSILLSISFIFIVILCNGSKVNSLKCYSCSTSAGDRFCTEDDFDDEKLNAIECKSDADVCVRVLNKSNGNVFRACGTSTSAKNPEITTFGFFPKKNKCITYNANNSSEFAGELFEICSCDFDHSNQKGDMTC